MNQFELHNSLTPPPAKRILLKGLRIIDSSTPEKSDARWDLRIENGRITSIDPHKNDHSSDADWKICDASEFLAFPPLWNSHTHCALNFFRGLGHEAPGDADQSMIEQVLFPAEKNLTPDLVEPLSMAHILEGLRSGVGTFVDHYYYVDGVGKALERFGLRGYIGETVADLGGAKPGWEAWTRAKEKIESWSFSSRVRPVLAPHAADTLSRKLLTEVANFAKQNRLPLHMHLAQTEGEFSRVQRRENGLSPVAFAEQCGALGAQSLVVHMVETSDSDLTLVKKSGASIGFCPVSQIIYHRLAPIKNFYEHKIPILIGTDCAASNDSGNVLQELKFAAIVARDRGLVLKAKEILSWATTNPAKVFSGSADHGLIQKGNPADLVFMKCDSTMYPAHNWHNNFIYSSQPQNIRHQMIDGKWTMWNGDPVQVDVKTIENDYREACKEILRRVKG